MGNAALNLAEFSSGLRCENIPSQALEAARRHMLDTFGVAIRGRVHPTAAHSLAGLEALGGSLGSVCVWGSTRTLSAAVAALANGVAAHVLDFDDTHTDAIVHGSAVVVPAVMALGEELDVGGEDLLAAFVAGWEVAARVGLASRGSFHRRGFHTTSIAGVFGAAAAASRLLRLTPEQTTHALGLAGSQASGINEYLSNGSSAKCFHTGWSAHAGIVAASLARSGMTGPASVFEGRDGLLRAYGDRDQSDVAALDGGLGSRWEMTRVSIKPYPCCHFAHAFIDCVGALSAKGIAAEEIASLECVVPEIELALICEPFDKKLRPDTPYAAKFSLPFLLAARIIQGRIDHSTFDAQNVSRADILQLAARVRYRVAKPDETPFPSTFPGWVEATLADGRFLVERLDVNAGHPGNPLSLEQVTAKFRDNSVEALGVEGVERLIAATRSLPGTSAAELAMALSGRASFHPQTQRGKPP